MGTDAGGASVSGTSGDIRRSAGYNDNDYQRRLTEYRNWYADQYETLQSEYDRLRQAYLSDPSMGNLMAITNDWERDYIGFLSGASDEMVMNRMYRSMANGGKGFLDISNQQLFAEITAQRQAGLLVGGLIAGFRSMAPIERSPRVVPSPARRPAAQYLIDDQGVTLQTDVEVTGSHPGRGKGYRQKPIGGVVPGEHRGHLVPEGAVDNPRLVNVRENIFSETPRSNLGPKRQFDNLVSQVGDAYPYSQIRVLATPLRQPGQIRPFAVTYAIEKDGFTIYSVTIPNK